jgi:HD-GYP domain-containing protein (c-di-GMP phosphodiesterase class II)
MKKIQLDGIQAGTKYTQDVFIDGKNLFVPAGVSVRQKDIDQLKRWGITQVQTDGEVMTDMPAGKAGPEIIDTRAFLKPNSVQANSEIYRLYVDMVEKLDAFFAQFSAGADNAKKTLDAVVQSVLSAVRDQGREIIGFVLGGDVQGRPLAKSSVNSAILSTVIGGQLKLPAYRILQLTTGALLHDIGMTRIPNSILHKQGDLAEDEMQKMRAHPLLSYKIITKELAYPEDVGRIGLQHHERWDGEGYPRKARGTDIDLLARIVSVADAFEAMVSEKPYRNSMIGYTAMKNLLSDNSRRFDPEVLRVLIKSMGIYPIGSIVLLNNSVIARVVDVHPDAPLRPRLRSLIDEYGKQYAKDEGELIDLLSEKTLFIAKAIDPKEYQEG